MKNNNNVIELKELFGGEGSLQYNAIYNAILQCGYDHEKSNKDDNSCYGWMEETPKTSLTVDLVDKLNELGFKIIKS